MWYYIQNLRQILYIATTPKNLLAATVQLVIIQNRPKVSQLTILGIISAFLKKLNAPRDILSSILWLGSRITEYLP